MEKKNGEEKGGKYSEKENIFFSGQEEKKRRKMRKIFEEDLSKNCQGFCQFLEGFSISFGEFGLGFGFKKIPLGKKYQVRFRRIWSGKKFQFRKICYRKKNLGFDFQKFGTGKSLGLGIDFVQNFGIVIQC